MDLFVKRMASRVLSQLRAQVRGTQDLPERLAHDLLFHVARVAPAEGEPLPWVSAAQAAWGLTPQAPVDYAEVRLGRFDPAWVTQARKRVAAAKDAWSAVAGGETLRLQTLPEQFNLVADSVRKLLPQGDWLAEALLRAGGQTVQGGTGPAPALAMEVATSLLYVEATLEDGDFDPPEQSQHVQRLSHRIDQVARGGASEPLEAWMEELYRRVSDRQTMGSVVQELRASLTDAEQHIDKFFRNPADRTVLIPVPAQLSAMRGVLSVLGMDRASQAVLRMRDDVDALVSTEVDPERAAAAGTFDRLASNLGALGFLIDMVSVQPQLAKSLFAYDPATGILSPVMGRESAPPVIGAGQSAPALLDQARQVVDAVHDDGVPLEQVSLGLQALSREALVQDQPELAAKVSAAQAAVAAAGAAGAGPATQAVVRETVSQAMQDFMATASGPVGLDEDSSTTPGALLRPSRPAPLAPVPAAAPADTGLEDDDEMREIFLEEAREVLDNAAMALSHLAEAPADISAMTTVRRAFHTLKGSSRMVGLKAYGEAGWACEQLYNAWLADQRPAAEPLLEVSADALRYLGLWTERIAAGAPGLDPAPVIAAAEALRLEGRLERIEMPGAEPAPAAAPVVSEPETPAEPVAEAAAAFDLPLEAPSDAPPAEALIEALSPTPDEEPAALPVPEAEPVIDFDFDLDALASAPTEPMALRDAEPAATAIAPDGERLSADAPPVPFDMISLDLGAPAEAAPPTVTDEGPMSAFDLPFDLRADAPVEAAADQPADVAAEAVPPDAPAPADAMPHDAPVPADAVPEDLSGALQDAAAAFDAPFDLPLDAPAVEAPLPSLADFELPDLALPDLALPVAEALPADQALPPSEEIADAQALAELAALDGAADAPAVAAPASLDAPLAPAPDEGAGSDQVRVIGPLQISIPLFNIYLNEADELSRRLSTELAEWALELHRPVGDTAQALAHSLAGSSATVGFADLSQLARALEHALDRANALGTGQGPEAALFVEAAEEIRRLLHQFAAGFLKSPPPELVARLHDYEQQTALLVERASQTAEFDTTGGGFEDAPHEPPLEPLALDLPVHAGQPVGDTAQAQFEPSPPVEAPRPDDDSGFAPAGFEADTRQGTMLGELGTPEFRPLAPLPVSSGARAVSARDALDDLPEGDEDIDAVDAVDPDLFPIFEEEAQELLPQLAAQMDRWMAHPQDAGASSACMRTLHTFKGGARLAGAMRLGELAHRLESAIERAAANEPVDPAGLEPLQARCDHLAAAFEALRRRDAQAYSEAEAAVAVASPPAPVAAVPSAQVIDFPGTTSRVTEPELAEPAPVVPEAPAAFEPLPSLDLPAEAAPLVAADLDAAALAEVPPAAPVAPAPAAPALIDWSRFAGGAGTAAPVERGHGGAQAVRVRSQLLDRLVNQAGEVSITRARLESEVGQIRGAMSDLTDNLERLRQQLRDIELQAETQMSSRLEAAKHASAQFDPLEFDRFTRFQEITRMMAESVNDVATVQRSLQRTLQTTEDELAAQARLTRDLQDDLLRTRMVEFDGLSDRLYRVVRLAAKETGKQVRLDIIGGAIEVDRGVLERMTGAFEHLLRNCVSHGIEAPAQRQAAGKDAAGLIVVALRQEGNEVSIEVRDDGAGLDLARIRARAVQSGLLAADAQPSDAELANLIFMPGFTTAETVTELAGRGVGMDVVRSEVNAMGGRIETASAAGQGTSFTLRLPLTTAVTQVVMLRCGDATVAVPSNLIEIVRRAAPAEVEAAYASGGYAFQGHTLPFFWLGALLQASGRGTETGRTLPVVVIRSAQQRVALHVDEVLGNQEVVVKNLGPQLSRVPGLAGMTLLASGAVALIYNPVALAAVYGEDARRRMSGPAEQPEVAVAAAASAPAAAQPLVLVVDDSLTVRRVTQRLLVREGYRVALAKDGLEALEALSGERPALVLSDIEMPRMDGFDLLRNIRADVALAALPVVMITSRIAQKHRDYALELGANHYLGKPYSEEELLALVRRYALEAARAAEPVA